MFLNFLFSSLMLGGVLSLPNAVQKRIEVEVSRAAASNSTSVMSVSEESGSIVWATYLGSELSTVAGYTLGSCVSVDGSTAVMFSNCKGSGTSLTYTITSCSSADCSSDCVSYDVPADSESDSTTSCHSTAGSWVDFPEVSYVVKGYNLANTKCSGDQDFYTGSTDTCYSSFNCMSAGTYSFSISCV